MGISCDNGTIRFTCDQEDVPALEHELVGSLERDGLLIAAIWKTPRVPYLGKDLAYFVYENVPHHAKADYQYWHTSGLAGCVLKPMLRTRAGLGKVTANELIDMIFNHRPLPESEISPTGQVEGSI